MMQGAGGMKQALAALLLVHGGIHLLGFLEAHGLVALPSLRTSIDASRGSFWLLAALLFLVSAALRVVLPAWWAIAALPAVVLSQFLIFGAWSDARAGSIPNLIVAIQALLSLTALWPSPFEQEYRRDVATGLTRGAALTPPDVVREADLERFPPIIQAWLRRVGVVGQPHVRTFRARFSGEMRNGRDAAWMAFTAEQHTLLDPPSRFFLMRAEQAGVPFVAWHRSVDGQATMRVRAASLWTVADARGPAMDISETVTFFNDLVVMAPAMLLDVNVCFEAISPRSVQATFTTASHAVSARLSFDDVGDLVGFVSSDRLQTTDGKTYHRYPWSTPLSGHRDIKGVRLPRHGLALWQMPGSDLPYGRFEIEEVTYNVTRP